MLLKELKLVEFTPISDLRDLGVDLSLPDMTKKDEGKKAFNIDRELEPFVKNYVLAGGDPSPELEVKNLLAKVDANDAKEQLAMIRNNVTFVRRHVVEALQSNEKFTNAFRTAKIETEVPDFLHQFTVSTRDLDLAKAREHLQKFPELKPALMSAADAAALVKKVIAAIEANVEQATSKEEIVAVLSGFFGIFADHGLLKARLSKATTELSASKSTK